MSYVPVVDISADPWAVGRELDEICRTAGFFQVTGHGIPDEVAERAWTTATRFFDLPLEDKLRVARPAPDYPYGYIPLAGESLSQSVAGAAPPDLKEVFNAGPPARPSHPFADPGEAWAYSPSLWPAALPELRVAWIAYYDAMRDLGNRLMSLFARGLELPPGFFAGQTGARRQSMPYFQNANWSAVVSCLPTCLEPGEKPRYEPVLAGPHLMGKFRRSVSL